MPTFEPVVAYGHLGKSFLGCQGADKLVRLNAPIINFHVNLLITLYLCAQKD